MKILNTQHEIRSALEAHIQKFGHRPEHHLYLYLYDVDPGYELVYFDFGKDGGIFANKKEKRWHIIDEPLTPRDKRPFLLLETAKHIFKDGGVKKISLEEWTGDLRQSLAQLLSSVHYRMVKPYNISYCPVINLEDFDENLQGGKFKGLRYVRNRFLKNHEVRIKNAAKISSGSMLELLEAWEKNRTAKDRVWGPDYTKFVKNKFPGCDIARAIFIDGALRGLAVGWRIPNSENYYIYMDIHDYSDEYLGEFVTLDHFIEAKIAGYKLLDFGGSDKPLLNFKQKFHPAYIYKTYNFSIMRK